MALKGSSKAPYRLLVDAWIDGVCQRAGAVLQLTEAEAKFPLLGGSIEPHAEPPAPEATAPRPRRRRRA